MDRDEELLRGRSAAPCTTWTRARAISVAGTGPGTASDQLMITEPSLKNWVVCVASTPSC